MLYLSLPLSTRTGSCFGLAADYEDVVLRQGIGPAWIEASGITSIGYTVTRGRGNEESLRGCK